MEDLLARLELMESTQKAHLLETKLTISAVSALRVDFKRLMEALLTRVFDAQEQATI